MPWNYRSMLEGIHRHPVLSADVRPAPPHHGCHYTVRTNEYLPEDAVHGPVNWCRWNEGITRSRVERWRDWKDLVETPCRGCPGHVSIAAYSSLSCGAPELSEPSRRDVGLT